MLAADDVGVLLRQQCRLCKIYHAAYYLPVAMPALRPPGEEIDDHDAGKSSMHVCDPGGRPIAIAHGGRPLNDILA